MAAMNSPIPHFRWALPLLTEALQDTFVLLIHGSRQCGKTTLARAMRRAMPNQFR